MLNSETISYERGNHVSILTREDGSVLYSAMIQVYADLLVKLMDGLKELENFAKEVSGDTTQEQDEKFSQIMYSVGFHIAALKLRSSWKWMKHLDSEIGTNATLGSKDIGERVSQLRFRILEDLGDRLFFCVTDNDKIDRFFKKTQEGNQEILAWKRVDEAFDASIIARFPDCVDDLIESGKCYVGSCYSACAFHLMRVVEQGLMEVAGLAGITDPSPSWGAVLNTVDKYCFRAKFEELPADVQKNRALLRELSAEMHAIQYAWRNRVAHIENKLIPVKPIDHPVATELMTTVQAFMRSLAARLPAHETDELFNGSDASIKVELDAEKQAKAE